LQQLAARLEEGTRVLTVSGTAGGAKALAIAKAILTENRAAAVIAPTVVEAQSLAQELRFYVDLLAPSPPEIVHLPSLEVDPYRGLSPHPEISAGRARALWQLLQDGPKILVASVKAASVRLHAPERFLNYCLMLKQDEELSPDVIREYLFESGYVEDDPVTDPGEFSLRGWNSSGTGLNRSGSSMWIPRDPLRRFARLKSFRCANTASGVICFGNGRKKRQLSGAHLFSPTSKKNSPSRAKGRCFQVSSSCCLRLILWTIPFSTTFAEAG